MSNSIRTRRDGEKEYEYAFIQAVGDQIVEETFWSWIKYPSHIKRIYVRTDDIENLEIKRAQVRRQIEDRKPEGFLSKLTPAKPVIEPAPESPPESLSLPVKKSSTIFQRYVPRGLTEPETRL